LHLHASWHRHASLPARRAILPALVLRLALCVALFVVLCAGPWTRPGLAAQAAPAFPDLALDLSAQNAAASLSRIPAQALLVVLVSYFCPPCHQEMPRLKELERRIRERGLAGRIRMVGLAAGDDQALVERFKDRHGGVPFALVPDPALAAHKRLGSPVVPTLYAVASSGGRLRLLSTHQGEFTEDPDAFLDRLLRALPAPPGTARAPRGK
jgi:thiol-disulfide isomerase/thioredoxin